MDSINNLTAAPPHEVDSITISALIAASDMGYNGRVYKTYVGFCFVRKIK